MLDDVRQRALHEPCERYIVAEAKAFAIVLKDTEKAITASMERTANKAMRMTMIEDSIASANRL